MGRAYVYGLYAPPGARHSSATGQRRRAGDSLFPQRWASGRSGAAPQQPEPGKRLCVPRPRGMVRPCDRATSGARIGRRASRRVAWVTLHGLAQAEQKGNNRRLRYLHESFDFSRRPANFFWPSSLV